MQRVYGFCPLVLFWASVSLGDRKKNLCVVTCEGEKMCGSKICANHCLPFATHSTWLSSHLPSTFTNLTIITVQNNWPNGKGIAAITVNILDGCTKGTKWHCKAANSKTQKEQLTLNASITDYTILLLCFNSLYVCAIKYINNWATQGSNAEIIFYFR